MSSQSPKNTNLPEAEIIDGNTQENSVKPSHIMTGDYAVLMETNGEEHESWYYFIRKEGNEESLRHLQDQLEKVDWYIIDNLSTFDLDLDNSVCARTAKEMTKLDINHYSFHRKFDGKLQRIDFNFTKKKSNEKKIFEVFDRLGYGQIEDYISDEDIDPEDLVEQDEYEGTDNEYETDSSSVKDQVRGRVPLSIKIEK